MKRNKRINTVFASTSLILRKVKKILWEIIQALLAIGLLMAGGLKPLQTISIVAAFPFAFIMLILIVAIFKFLKSE